MTTTKTDVAIIGAGSIGISVAYYLKIKNPDLDVVLIECDQPMAWTSAVSGENYRNWWPHPIMKQFMDRSIDLLEELDSNSADHIINTRSGYLLATRDAHPEALFKNLHDTFKEPGSVRLHNSNDSYQRALTNYQDGVELLSSSPLTDECYPHFDDTLKNIVHIRKGGSISAHNLGSLMLSGFKELGGKLHRGEVYNVERSQTFRIETGSESTETLLQADALVNCAGPNVPLISAHLGHQLPVHNVLQQKIAFADTAAVIRRDQPFTIDLDRQLIDWSEEECELLNEESALAFLTGIMPGSIHCRPEGGDNSNLVKLGWAYNTRKSASISRTPELDRHFPDVVLRGAARVNPGLKKYYGGFPGKLVHYGGYYTMTEENWPLIGKTEIPGYFVCSALSGFGSMAACGAGELTALYVLGQALPDYAAPLSLERYQNHALMKQIAQPDSKGIL